MVKKSFCTVSHVIYGRMLPISRVQTISSLGGKGVNFHPPAPALSPPGRILHALLKKTGARKGRRARGAENVSRSARARTGEKVHKSSRILHALLKKTCKTGGCLLKISDQDLPPPPGLTSEKFGENFRARKDHRAFTPVFTLRPG